MYERYYGLSTAPFSLLPDPKFLFLSRQHMMALTLLKYSVMNQHAFTVITGEVGSGKTTLLNQLLDEIDTRYTVGMINFTDTRIVQFWPWILQAFGLPDRKNTVKMYDAFIEFVVAQYEQDRRTVLVVDEAQNLTQKALENLRMLSNINTRVTLLQLVLVGQPEFRETLKRPDFRQLNQRVSVFYRLDPLSEAETSAYAHHRLGVAGATRRIFTPSALSLIWKESGGVARSINTLCDMALVYGYSNQKQTIDEEVVHEMLADRRDYGVQTEAPAAQTDAPVSSAAPQRDAAALKVVPR